jgi:hypothetical protein
MGYFAVCLDTENNAFAIWESSESAKWITYSSLAVHPDNIICIFFLQPITDEYMPLQMSIHFGSQLWSTILLIRRKLL